MYSDFSFPTLHKERMKCEVAVHWPGDIPTRTGIVISCSAPWMPNIPWTRTVESPMSENCPSTRSGRNVTSGNRALSRTSFCILLSRPLLPLLPLAASTRISPVILFVAGSKRMAPRFKLNDPCTVWRISPSMKLTVDLAGTKFNSISC